MAATKALDASKHGSLLTRNIHSELVLNLSAERNVSLALLRRNTNSPPKISASLRKFGLNVKETHLIVAAFNAPEEKVLQNHSKNIC